MYSGVVNGQTTTFGTSGLLYRSNKVMYDRATRSLWNQFSGEPIIGTLADSGIQQPFFPSVVSTWGGMASRTSRHYGAVPGDRHLSTRILRAGR